MERRKLISPGHADPLDTMVALGTAVAILECDPESEVRLTRAGAYELQVVTSASSEDILRHVHATLSLQREKLELLLRPQPAVKAESILDTVKEASEEYDLFEAYGARNHAFTYGEYRRKPRQMRGKGGKTAYLQFAPWAGKFAFLTYEAKEAPYTVCPLCSALAWYGAVRAAFALGLLKGNSVKIAYALPTLTPEASEGLGSDDILLLTVIFGEKMLTRSSDVPALALPLVALSMGETIYPLKWENINILVWTHVNERGAIGIRAMANVPIEKLLAFVKEAKARGVNLSRLVQTLLEGERRGKGLEATFEGAPELLAMLSECILFGSPDPYTVTRNLWSLRVDSVARELSKSFVEALLKVWSS